MEHWWNDISSGNPSTRRKTSSSVTSSITHFTWIDLGSKPGLRVERPATNRLRHDTKFDD